MAPAVRCCGCAAEPPALADWGCPAGTRCGRGATGDVRRRAEAFTTINPATHYGDLIPKWINGETFEMRISRQAVAADNQRHVKYVPAEE